MLEINIKVTHEKNDNNKIKTNQGMTEVDIKAAQPNT